MLILKFSGAKVEFDCSTDKNKKNSTQSNRAENVQKPCVYRSFKKYKKIRLTSIKESQSNAPVELLSKSY